MLMVESGGQFKELFYKCRLKTSKNLMEHDGTYLDLFSRNAEILGTLEINVLSCATKIRPCVKKKLLKISPHHFTILKLINHSMLQGDVLWLHKSMVFSWDDATVERKSL